MTVITPDTFDALKRYVGVRLQQGVPLVDADWNELEDARRFELRAFLKWFAGDGVPAGNDGFRIVGTGASDDFTVSSGLAAGVVPDGLRAAGRCLVDGVDVMITADIGYRAQPLHASNGASAVAEAARLGGVSTIPDLPTTTGPALVFLDVWERAVTPAEDPGLILTGLGVESCARRKREWAVRTRAGTTLPQPGDADFDTLPGPHSRYPLALIDRRAGDPVVRPFDVTDLRERRLNLLPEFLLEDTLGAATGDYRRGRDRPVVSLREAINALLRGELPSTADAPISPAPGADLVRRGFALDGAGGLVAIWRSNRVGATPQIFATRLDLAAVDAGFAVPPVQVTSVGTNDEPNVAVLPGAELAVVYRVGAGAAADVRFRRGQLSALPGAAEVDVAATAGANERAPTVLAAGSHLVFFVCRTSPAPSEWMVRRFRLPAGPFEEPAGPTVLAPTFNATVELDLHAAAEPGGTIWVAFGTGADIRAFQYAPGSGARTNEITLDSGSPDAHPFVLVTGDGTPYVFWHSAAATPGIAMARFTSGAWTAPATATTLGDDLPAAAEAADGGIWLVTERGPAAAHDLFAQRLDPNTMNWGAARQLTTSPGDDARPFVVVDPASSLWLFWASDRNQVGGAPDVDLFYKRLVTAV